MKDTARAVLYVLFAAFAASLFLAFSMPARAADAPKPVATTPGQGAKVLLFDVAGPCVGAARLAEHVDRAGKKTPGCWITDGTAVQVAFLDGEVVTLPVGAFKPMADV